MTPQKSVLDSIRAELKQFDEVYPVGSPERERLEQDRLTTVIRVRDARQLLALVDRAQGRP